jgi:hypothetical protein
VDHDFSFDGKLQLHILEVEGTDGDISEERESRIFPDPKSGRKNDFIRSRSNVQTSFFISIFSFSTFDTDIYVESQIKGNSIVNSPPYHWDTQTNPSYLPNYINPTLLTNHLTPAGLSGGGPVKSTFAL